MFEWFTEFMESPLGKLISTGILAVAVLLLTLAAAGLVNRLMKKLVDRHRKTNSSIATVLGFVRYIAVAAVYFAGGMVIVGAIPVLSSAVRTLLAPGGVIAVVAGLAAQEALGSVVSGVMILAFKPFKMGDVVRYVDNDITGCVEEITLHHTAVRTFENKRVIIPNSKMNSAIIENADYAVPDSGDYLRKRPQKSQRAARPRGAEAAGLPRYSHRAAEKGRRARCAGRCA